MPRRTVSVSHVYVHTERKPKERKPIDNFDGNGSDLLVLLRAFVKGVDPNLLVDDTTERYVSIDDLEGSGRTLFCQVEAGWFGQSGKIKNVKTHEVEHEHTAESATTRTIRFVAVAPKGAKGMLVFTERVGGVNSSTRILALFHKALRHHYDGEKLSFKIETMVESAAWLQKAELERVTGVVNSYGYNSDVADAGNTKEIGRLVVDLVPSGKLEFLPKKVWLGLKNKNLSAAKVLGLSEDVHVDQISVKVSADGKSKVFAIENEKEPALAYLLAARGDVDSAVFIDFCFDHAKDLLPNVGSEWKAALKNGTWNPSDLDVTLELPSE